MPGLLEPAQSHQLLIADAFHSGVDVVAIFASWLGLWLASRKKVKDSPMDHTEPRRS